MSNSHSAANSEWLTPGSANSCLPGDCREGNEACSHVEVAARAIKEAVAAMAASGIDGKTIAMALAAAATQEMTAAYGREQAMTLAAQMYVRAFPSL